MVKACSALFCKLRDTKDNRKAGISFHKFPKDQKLRAAWARATKREGLKKGSPWIPPEYAYLCSKHFSFEDFEVFQETCRLRNGTIPSIFEFSNDAEKSLRCLPKGCSKVLKDQKSIMAQKAEDFNLPLSAISKIVKEAIPEGVQVTDVAKVALSKAASVFILYSTSSANNFSHAANRKRIMAKDVFDALTDMKLEFLNHPLHNALAAHQSTLQTKKQIKESKRASNAQEEPEQEEANMETSAAASDYDIITLDSESEDESGSAPAESSESED